jgi:FkbH-like protein
MRGVDLNVAATFPDDIRFASERAHDVILIGALRSRREIAAGNPGAYIDEAGLLIQGLRDFSAKPILIDNLPEPTVQPLGLAERGPDGHRNRYRRVNLALSELAEKFSDVHVVDVAAALGLQGAQNLLDDGLVSFTHFGSPGWMLQRPESELAAVHGIFPDLTPLATAMGGDPYRRESIVARLHADHLTAVLALDRKKCVIVDLDGTLWPGVLAETGAPFAWTPEISGTFSFVGLYFGIHEALRMLIQRGIVLACVSKNDEATVRELWKYPSHYPHDRLLKLDHFVTHRINWEDKVENIRSIADELGFALDAFLFVDDNPLERERVKTRLSEVAVLGDDLFALRRQLLDDPRLQTPRITEEGRQRTELTKAQLDRAKIRQASSSESAFLAGLNVECEIERLNGDADFGRIRELFERTTQFNTTGRKFTNSELAALAAAGGLYAMRVRDRFGDHGLVAAAAIEDHEIIGFVMSCRVIGLGAEHRLLDRILSDLSAHAVVASGRIMETARNIPVRNLYRDHGFACDAEGRWQIFLNDDVKNSVTIAAQP